MPSFLFVWPRKIRVGLNSPSLCPTMSSVTNTSLKTRPLCTLKVNPTNSGTIVQERAQVFSGSRRPVWFRRCTFLYRLSSTYGPFFRLRPMRLPLRRRPAGRPVQSDLSLPVTLADATPDDQLAAGLLTITRRTALGVNTRRAARRAVALALALATAERVVVVIAGHAAGDGPAAEVAAEARLAQAAVLVVGVADLTDRRAALGQNAALLAGRQHQRRV